jgi:hypothetical protein
MYLRLKMRRIFWFYERLLASQEELCSMELLIAGVYPQVSRVYARKVIFVSKLYLLWMFLFFRECSRIWAHAISKYGISLYWIQSLW